MGKFFNDLKKGLKEIDAYKKGTLKLRSKIIEIPEPPREYKAKQIKNIRERGDYSQDTFARIFNVSLRTIQSWESGNRVPTHATLRLLEIIDKGIYRP